MTIDVGKVFIERKSTGSRTKVSLNDQISVYEHLGGIEVIQLSLDKA